MVSTLLLTSSAQAENPEEYLFSRFVCKDVTFFKAVDKVKDKVVFSSLANYFLERQHCIMFPTYYMFKKKKKHFVINFMNESMEVWESQEGAFMLIDVEAEKGTEV